jgi:peroxiredoxin
MKKSFSLLIIVTILLGNALRAAPEIGKEAPDFTLTDSHGQSHTLSDYRGQHVVLEWLNHDCPFVKKFYGVGKMQALQKQVTEEGGIWLVINSSAPGEQGHLTADAANAVSEEKNAAQTALLLDHEGKVGRAYDAKVTPHMYVIDPNGILIYNGAIDSIRSANAADIEKADNYVLAALHASKAGQPVEHATTRPYGCGIKYR